MRWLYALIVGVIFITFGCGDKNPVSNNESTDEEAIYNVVILDNFRLSEIIAFPEIVPDTTAFIANPGANQPLYWHVVDSTVERMPIVISDTQVQSPIGLVDQANASYSIKWFGIFHTLNYNVSADSIERYAKEFEINGSRTAVCQRWGSASRHRGWLLTAISGANIYAGGGQPFLQDLHYISPSNDDSLLSNLICELDDLARFDTDEEITLRYGLSSENDQAYIFIPYDDYKYQLAAPVISGNGYEVTVIMPSQNRIYGQLRFYVVNAGNFEDAYKSAGFSYSYWMR